MSNVFGVNAQDLTTPRQRNVRSSIWHLLVVICTAVLFSINGVAQAQVTSPSDISGIYPIGQDNLSNTNRGSNTAATFTGLGENQGVTFDFSASLSGNGEWRNGIEFTSATEIQVQARETGDLASDFATYSYAFSAPVYGLQFQFDGFDFDDTTTITFSLRGVQVPVPLSVVTSTGSNVNATLSSGSITLNGPGNVGGQEFANIELPLDLPIDQIRMTPTGKGSGTGNVTLQLRGHAWARPDIALTKSSSLDLGTDGISSAGDVITFTYVVENNGNVPLTNVSMAETTFTGSDPAPSFGTPVGTGGATAALLPQGETLTYTNTYALTAADIAAGTIDNQAQVTATPEGGTVGPDNVTDLSDSSNAGDGGNVGSEDEDDVTVTTIPAPPAPLPTPLTPLVPQGCGFIIGESYLLNGLGIGNERSYQLASGSLTDDPDAFFGPMGAELGYIKNADGSIDMFFNNELPVASIDGELGSVFFTNESSVNGGALDQTNAAEFWRGRIQLFGEPGQTYSFVMDNGNAHEFIHYWVDDTNGVVADSSLGAPNSANGWLYGTGAAASTSGPNPITADRFTTISYTVPTSNTDGIIFLNILLLDPQVGFGRITFDNDLPPCPEPELTLTKVADNEEPVAGQVVTYTYTATNAGNVTIDDVTVTDNHGGAGTLGAIALDSFTSSSATTSDDGSDALVDKLGPGDTATFTAEYVATETDEGTTVSNTATVGGDPFGGTLNPEADRQATETVDVIEPALEIIKSITGFTDSNSSATLDAGDVVTFEFTAANNGDVSLADISVTDTGLSPITLTPVSGVALAPGDGPTVVATATYVLTALDIAAGGIENTATGSAQMVETDGAGRPVVGSPLLDENGDPLDPVVDTSDAGTEPTVDPATGVPATVGNPDGEETLNADGSSSDSDLGNDPTSLSISMPGIQVVKSVSGVADTNSNGFTDEGDVVSFTFIVTNTGNTALENVTVTDLTATVAGGPVNLAIGANDSVTFTATYALQATDVAAGGVQNSAEATGDAVDQNGNTIGDPFNPGQPLMASDTSDAGTDADGNAVVGNELSETAALDGSTDGDTTNDPTVFLIEPAPSIEIIKTIASVTDVNANNALDENDTITYEFTVTNTGNVALANVTVSDPLVTVSGGPIALGIGETAPALTFSGTYTIGAADVAAGGVENTAQASGEAVDATGAPITDPITGVALTANDDSDSGSESLLDSAGNPVSQANADTTDGPALDGSTDGDPTNDPTVLFIPNPELTVVKSLANALDDNVAGGDGLFGGDGDTLVFQFTVTNTGNVDLQNVMVSDPLVTMTGGPIDLAVGAGDSLTFQGTYTVLPADTARGFFENSASAVGDAVDGSGNPIFGPSGGALQAMDTSDTGTDPEGDAITDPANEDSDPNANPNITGATAPDGELDNDPTVAKVPGNPNPQLSVIKSVASVADTTGDGQIGEGDMVTYSFSVTNTGNLDLVDVMVSDNLATVTGGPIAQLALGATDSTTFEATSVITAAQAASGAVENTATATGLGVNSAGDPITEGGVQVMANDTSDAGSEPEVGVSGAPTAYADPEGNETPNATGGTDTDPTNDPTVLFLPMPEITIVKSVSGVADTNGNGFTDAGDTVSYAFAVENTGNTDLTNIAVSDPLPGIVVSGSPIAALAQSDAPDTSVTATYVLTAGDIAAGGVENTASATGTAVDTNGDPLGDPLNPGNPLEVTGSSDAGTDPNGDPVTDPSTTETAGLDGSTDGATNNDPTVFMVAPAPALTLTKSISAINDLDGDGLPGVGDQVVYSFVVTNTGNVDLADVTIADPIGIVSGGPIGLAIGATDTSSFTLTHVISTTNVADAAIENSAVATGTAVDASGDPIIDPITGGTLTASDDSDAGTAPEVGASGLPDAVANPETTETSGVDGTTDGDPTNDPTVLVLPNPELTVVKSTVNVFDTNGDGLFGGEDDEIDYQFTVTNTGNVDLINISMTDSITTVNGGPIDLMVAEGDSLTFTATYVVQAADVATGFVENTAEATGEAVNAAGAPLLGLDGNPITVSDTSDTGTDPDVAPIVDPAGTESPDGLGATDNVPGNDPTVTRVPSNPLPQIDVIKSIASVTDNGDGVIGIGDTVNYIFTVTNTGNVDLADVTVTDPTAIVTGGPISLAVGTTNTSEFAATYVLTAADVTAGGVENTASADGNAVNSLGDPILDGPGGTQLSASDSSDAGTEPEVDSAGLPQTIADPAAVESPSLDGSTDADPTNDPTVLFIPTPGITIVKSVASVPDSNNDGTFGGIGDVLTYNFTVTNTGNTALANIFVIDPTATVSGGPISLPVGGVDTTSFTATYTVTANDVNVVGFVENSAEAFGDAVNSDGSPVGDPANPGMPLGVRDTSDTGTDSTAGAVTDPEATETEFASNGDGDTTNDPTITLVPAIPVPMIEIVKSVAAVVDTDGDAVLGGEDDVATYQFDVTNTGSTILANVVVNDPLLGGVIATVPNIAVGDTVTFAVNYTITEADQTRGFVENSATVEGEAQNALGTRLLDPITGAPLGASDVSDTGTDPSTDPVTNPSLTESPDGAGGTNSDPTDDPTLLTVPLAVPDTGLSGTVFFDDDGNSALDAGENGLTGFIVNLIDSAGDIIANTVSDANGFYQLAGFPIGTHRVEFIDPVSGEVVGTIQGLAFTQNTVLTNQNQPVAAAPAPGQLLLTKTTPLSVVSLGSSVPYTITVENVAAVPVTADIVDSLPPGFVYTPNSATIDGASVEPISAGNTLTWSGLTVGVGATVTLQLIARVGPDAPTGNLVNTVNAVDPATGTRLATPAVATVRREVEAIFDCSDVIGKVFDDRNFDGYQNPPAGSHSHSHPSEDAGPRHTHFHSHGSLPAHRHVEAELNDPTYNSRTEVEPGLPRVRLVTPTGTIITTDEYGRYSVPCAELPRDMGSNFTLKLDERSLPTGYRVTTENPRTMRLTAGIMAELNFGAAIGRVIDIDLTAAAFNGSNEPVERLLQGVERLLSQVASDPAVLRLSYFSSGEDTRAVNRKLKRLEDHIQTRWRRVGDYRLIVELNIKSLQ